MVVSNNNADDSSDNSHEVFSLEEIEEVHEYSYSDYEVCQNKIKSQA
jgi:hypothetical protein